jgi:hypothetical protein
MLLSEVMEEDIIDRNKFGWSDFGRHDLGKYKIEVEKLELLIKELLDILKNSMECCGEKCSCRFYKGKCSDDCIDSSKMELIEKVEKEITCHY